MTAQAVISRIQKLPSRERRKVYTWVDRKLAALEDELDRKAVLAVKAKIDVGEPTVPWEQVKKEIGL